MRKRTCAAQSSSLTVGWVMNDPGPHLYTREEWEALSDHDRDLLREHRRREVDAARVAHQRRAELLDALTVERFSHGR